MLSCASTADSCVGGMERHESILSRSWRFVKWLCNAAAVESSASRCLAASIRGADKGRVPVGRIGRADMHTDAAARSKSQGGRVAARGASETSSLRFIWDWSLWNACKHCLSKHRSRKAHAIALGGPPSVGYSRSSLVTVTLACLPYKALTANPLIVSGDTTRQEHLPANHTAFNSVTWELTHHSNPPKSPPSSNPSSAPKPMSSP
jgi:hypothetical protein